MLLQFGSLASQVVGWFSGWVSSSSLKVKLLAGDLMTAQVGISTALLKFTYGRRVAPCALTHVVQI